MQIYTSRSSTSLKLLTQKVVMDSGNHGQVWLSTQIQSNGAAFHDGMMACKHVCKMMESSLNPLKVTNGAKRGCVMTPTMFSMIFSAIFIDAFLDSDTVFLFCFFFQSDTVLMAIYSTLK